MVLWLRHMETVTTRGCGHPAAGCLQPNFSAKATLEQSVCLIQQGKVPMPRLVYNGYTYLFSVTKPVPLVISNCRVLLVKCSGANQNQVGPARQITCHGQMALTVQETKNRATEAIALTQAH
eukprot:m.103908 g.103908  ORF g.103908 m.103908 type:complete len:122 (+) comp37198_c0_seq5:1320-1685(+)